MKKSEEEETEEVERKEKEVMNTIKKNTEVVGHAVIETYIGKGLVLES